MTKEQIKRLIKNKIFCNHLLTLITGGCWHEWGQEYNIVNPNFFSDTDFLRWMRFAVEYKWFDKMMRNICNIRLMGKELYIGYSLKSLFIKSEWSIPKQVEWLLNNPDEWAYEQNCFNKGLITYPYAVYNGCSSTSCYFRIYDRCDGNGKLKHPALLFAEKETEK